MQSIPDSINFTPLPVPAPPSIRAGLSILYDSFDLHFVPVTIQRGAAALPTQTLLSLVVAEALS